MDTELWNLKEMHVEELWFLFPNSSSIIGEN